MEEKREDIELTPCDTPVDNVESEVPEETTVSRCTGKKALIDTETVKKKAVLG